MPRLGDFVPVAEAAAVPQPRMSHFHCPECGSGDLEEVSKAITYCHIAGFYGDYEDYWDRETEELEVIRMQCYNCGFTVCEGKPQNMFSFLVRKGWIQYPDGNPVTVPQEDWSV